MKINLGLITCSLTTLFVGLPFGLVQAESTVERPVQTMSSNQAQGLTGSIPVITVWAGTGSNLNFLPTGETIKKVWLDDPSQITLDFDESMCLSSESREQKNCEDSAAAVIHLRRIHPINFPNLPRTSSTLLTVITQAPTGNRKLYQFRIAYGKGNPQSHTLSIQPEPSSFNTPTVKINARQQASLDDVELGLRIARSKNLLSQTQANQNLEMRVQNFLANARNGASINAAAQQAGVSLPLISKLAEFGLEAKLVDMLKPRGFVQPLIIK